MDDDTNSPDDDAPTGPALSVLEPEGATRDGESVIVFTVELSEALDQDVTFDFTIETDRLDDDGEIQGLF